LKISGQRKFLMKIPNVAITAAAVVIVVILVLGLVLGLGVVGGRRVTTTTSTVTETQTLSQTVTQQNIQTQTVVSTTSLPPTTQMIATTETVSVVSQSLVTIPTTFSSTTTVFYTTSLTSTASSSTTGVITLLQAGSQIDFAAGQAAANVPQADLTLGYNGFFVISWQTNTSTPVYWTLQGNAVNESSYSQPSGGVEFPAQSYIPYLLTVHDGLCSPYCDNAFNVTVSIYYEY
jgi:hypothetical protein